MAPGLASNVVVNEVLPLGAPVEVTSTVPLDPRSAQAAIVLEGEGALVLLSDDGRTASVYGPAGGPLGPGPHLLKVEELQAEDRDPIAECLYVPFVVSDTIAEIPAEVRLHGMVRLAIDDLDVVRLPAHSRPDRSFIEIFKAVNRASGARVDFAFDQAGHRVDAAEVLASVAQRRQRKFGKLSPDLYRRVEEDSDGTVTVAVWLRTSERSVAVEKSPDAPSLEPPDVEQAENAEAREISERFSREVTDSYAAVVEDPDPDAPMLVVTLPAARVRELSERDDVTAVLVHASDAIPDLGTSIAVANSDDVQAQGLTGTGVNVAVWEDGPDQVNQLPIVATFDPAFVGTSQHARHTHAIVANTQAGAPHGHAPGCALHSANRSSIAALRWAVRDRGCTVISQSFHRSTEPGSGDLQADDIYKDWLALRQPYPTIVQAAGNYWLGDEDAIVPPSAEFVNHKTYNGLVVGNHDDSASAISGDSVFRNPNSPQSDRELPEIAANGTAVTTVGLTMSGTSMAAPAVAGAVALLQGADNVLKSWPEGCRAIMMAGAWRTPGSGTWSSNVATSTDSGQGSGCLDVQESLAITQSRRRPGSTASRCGWNVGTLRSTDIGSNEETMFSYQVLAPALMSRPYVKIVLAWDSAVLTNTPPGGQETPFASILSTDLDLHVYDPAGQLVAQCSTWDNSYEIVEFVSRPGVTYTVRFRHYAGSNDVWYGVAWSVQSRPAFLLP